MTMKNVIIILCLSAIFSCKKKERRQYRPAREWTPISFIEAAKHNDDYKGVDWFFVADDFPKDWVKKEDIKRLIVLLDSKEKCDCYVSPLSSYLPKDSADVGGYAAAFIKSYIDKKPIDFSLYSCPKVNKEDSERIKKWWKENE